MVTNLVMANSRLTLIALLLGLVVVLPAEAKVYIYRGPDGERMVTDHPLPPGDTGYVLLTKRDTLKDAGYILAKKKPPVGTAADYRAYIRAASRHYKVDPDLVESVVFVESSFNPEAVSKQGASGLMQLMWKTAQRYQVDDRFNPRENIFAGVKHLAFLMKKFDGKLPLVLAAWNAGAGSVERYGGVPPFPETRRFIKKVLAHHRELKELYTSR